MTRFSWKKHPELEKELARLMRSGMRPKDICAAMRAAFPEYGLRKAQIVQRMYDLTEHAHGKATDPLLAGAEKRRIKAEARVRELERMNGALLKSATDIEALIASIEATGAACANMICNVPSELPNTPGASQAARKRTAVLLVSDWHSTEVVRADVTRGINAYDMDTLARRVWALSRKTRAWLRDARRRWDIERLIVCILGDQYSGVIHNLQETNECDPGFGVVWTGALTGQLIGTLAYDLPVEVHEVPGNHGRFGPKPKHKVPRETFDWLIGAFAHAQLGGLIKDKRIVWDRHNGWFDDFVVYGRRYVIAHGDQVRGSLGIPYYGIKRLISSIREQQAMLDDRERARGETLESVSVYQVLIGHFHRPALVGDMVMNGTVKGVDEFSTHEGMSPVPAMQVGFLVDPEYGTCGVEMFDVSNAVDPHGFALPEG